MAKALKPFIVMMFILSIAALIFGIYLFQQREALKGRALLMQHQIMKVMGQLTNVTTTAEVTATTVPLREVGAFHIQPIPEQRSIDYDRLMIYTNMEPELDKLLAATVTRFNELDDIYHDYSIMTVRLVETNKAFVMTNEYLATTLKILENTRQELATTRAELAKRVEEISQLKQEVSNLKDTIDARDDEIAKLKDVVKKKNDEIKMLEERIEVMVGDVGLALKEVPPGLTGKVVDVNPEWNYCIIDLGRTNKLAPTAKMIIHRNDQMVGVVKLTQVNETMSIGEIDRQWQVLPIQSGDVAFFAGIDFGKVLRSREEREEMERRKQETQDAANALVPMDMQ